MTTVLWDFNGTILNDMQLTIDINNDIFNRYGYKPVEMAEYLRIFRFPVHDYYMDLGISEEAFPVVAREWAEAYAAQCDTGCFLQPGVCEAVERLKAAGCPQVIISASQRDTLMRQIALYPELDGRFNEILGLDDIYAASKVDIAVNWLKRSGIDPKDAVFFGDTTHDAEVSEAIGCRCILIAAGHQCEEVLQKAGVPVVQTLKEAVDLVLS